MLTVLCTIGAVVLGAVTGVAGTVYFIRRSFRSFL